VRPRLTFSLLVTALALGAIFIDLPSSDSAEEVQAGVRTGVQSGPVVLRGSSVARPPAAPAQPPAPSALQERIVRGRVISDATGLPVAGASICVAREGVRLVDMTAAVQSDGRGEFQLHAPEHSGYRLVVVAQDHFPNVSELPAGDSPKVEVRLDGGAEIAGRVSDAAGAPVVGVRVWCHLPGVTFGWPHVVSSVSLGPVSAGATGLSDEQGRFHLRGLSYDAKYRLRVAKRGWVVAPDKRSFQFTYSSPRYVSPGEDGIDVRMTAVFSLVVQPRDGTTGRRLSGRVYPENLARAGLALIGDHSPFDDLFDPSCGASESGPRHSYRFLSTRKTAKLHEGASVRFVVDVLGYQKRTVAVPVRMGSEAVFPVNLVREDGVWGPVAVTAHLPDGRGYSGSLALKIGSGGRVWRDTIEFEGGGGPKIDLPPGTYNAVPLGGGSSGQWWGQAGPAVPFEVRSGGSAALLRLALSGGRVAVRAVTPRGDPVRGFGLSVKRAGSSSAWPVSDWDAPGVRADAAGLGEVPHLWLSAGTFTLRVFGPGYHSERQVIEVRGGGETIQTEFVLAPK